ncbi:MAG: hypothetical protein KAR39_03905 [Thermoplasmata archaeon]|nr:hypothetical protein [Thermoplasmata archaeon]
MIFRIALAIVLFLIIAVLFFGLYRVRNRRPSGILFILLYFLGFSYLILLLPVLGVVLLSLVIPGEDPHAALTDILIDFGLIFLLIFVVCTVTALAIAIREKIQQRKAQEEEVNKRDEV